MGFVGGLLGTAGGVNGTGISGPQSAQIDAPVNTQQAQDALKQQQAFINALSAQNGLGNQTAVYNQLANVAAGQGPNPAQAQLANATGANVANQAALMAGQRGSSANPGLIARQAAMQGGNLQQQAAGQGAALQAQQSLNALGQMGGMANTQAAQQGNMINAYTGNNLNQINAQNSARVGMQSNINNANAGMAGQVMQGQNALMGGIAGGIGKGLAMMADGGEIEEAPMPNFGNPGANALAQGMSGLFSGALAPPNAVYNPSNTQIKKEYAAADTALGPTKNEGFNPQLSNKILGEDRYASGGTIGPQSRIGKHFHALKMAEGGQVPALVSPGEKYLAPQDVKKVEKGANPMAVGEKIPGKPKVGGAKNSYANDTVPKTLEEGGIVLPRSVTQAKNPHWEAKKFVEAILAKNKGLK